MGKKAFGGTRLLVGGLLLGWLGGCGYQFAGRSELFPKDVQRIYVAPFINRTRAVGIENELTSAVRSEFFRRRELTLVDRPEEADAVVSGVIRDFGSRVAAVNRKDEVLQYEAQLAADVTLRRREPDEILWRRGIQLTDIHSGARGAVVTTSSAFRSGTLNADDVGRMTDIQLSETESRAVRDRLIERFAREIHQRLLEMF
ncbi:MAG TPA: LPS assembly lipoprotein LptE [candidate division Zixibacteria bacterium]|nr:LPS assembly lipoprotein LptE [candidate division Zixibacteria bacterium]